MYFLYSLLFTFGLILTAPYYLWRLRSRSGGMKGGAGWRERIGLLPSEPRHAPAGGGPSPEPGSIWVHAVSVGETLAVVPLVKELQRLYPDRKIFLSHVTPAGRQASESKLPGVAGRFYLPLDWRWAADNAVERVRPALLVIVETELWPNLLRSAHLSGAKVALVNARLSERSFRGYRLVRPFMKCVLENIDWIGAQTASDAERFRALGAKPERVEITGNVKFDAAKDPSSATPHVILSTAKDLFHFPKGREKVLSVRSDVTPAKAGARFPNPESRTPIFVAASTMPGEETLLLPAWRAIRRKYPHALLILAPRHPARFDQVAQLLAANGLSFVRRTALQDGHSREEPAPANAEGGNPSAKRSEPGTAQEIEILLLDTIGELAGIFSLADLVFMGGSLVPTGGHNLLEPAFWGKPILFGPHMENFRDVSSLFLNAGAAMRVRDASELGATALELLTDEPRRTKLGQAAKEVLERQTGATGRILNRLRPWLAKEKLVIV
jgi:3-deoxy-D-manno-octulosonic-acid transferase